MGKKALILGGSGGLSGILAKLAEEYYEEIWILTRGKKIVEGKYRQLQVDRNDKLGFSEAVLGAGVHWDVVFDCICMNASHAEQDLQVLSQCTERLVVISTDSVYASEHKKILQAEEGIFVGDMSSEFEIPSYALEKRNAEKVFESYFKEKTEASSMKVTIFRPGHIFGPRFLFGCFPMQSRQKELLEIMKTGTIRLVGRGCYLLHPIYAQDLAKVMLECVENTKTFQEFFCIGGPEIIENSTYYYLLAEIMGIKIEIQEIPITGFLKKNPEYYGHLCHRAYDLSKLSNTGIKLPVTGVKQGLEAQYRYWKEILK